MPYATTMCLCSLSRIPLQGTLPTILCGNRMSIGDGSNGWRDISLRQQHRRSSEQGKPPVSLNCRFVGFWWDKNEKSHAEAWLCVTRVVSASRRFPLLPPAVAQEAGCEEEPGGGWSPKRRAIPSRPLPRNYPMRSDFLGEGEGHVERGCHRWRAPVDGEGRLS
jgi:hypothetical protein